MTKSKKILNIFTAVIVGLFLACTIASFAIRAATQPKVETTQAWEYDFTLGQDYAQILTVPRAALLSETRSFFDEEGTEYTYEQYYVYVATSSLGLFGEVFDAERVNVNLFPIEEYAPEDYHPENSGIYIHAGDDRISVEPEDAADYGWSPFTIGDDLVLVNCGTLNYWHKIILTELDRVEEGTRVRMMPEKAKEEAADTLSNGGDKSSAGKSGKDAGTGAVSTGEVPPAVNEDIAGFELPAATDTLVLYSGDWLQALNYNAAIPIFEELYPGVSVELHKFGEDEFNEVVRAEIAAGKGPDLLFGRPATTLRDVYKTMEAGVFEDLDPYIQADGTFSLDDYIGGVMDVGVFRGQRFLLPVAHQSLILTTSAEAMAEEGFTLDDLSTLDGFASVCEKYRERNPGKYALDGVVIRNPEDRLMFTFVDLYEHSGLRFFDYENRTVVLDRDLLKEMCDLCILYHPDVVEKEITEKNRKLSEKAGEWDMILKRLRLFTTDGDMGISFMMTRWAIRNGGETPVSLFMPSAEGGGSSTVFSFGAIPKGAANKLNAWRFLKILLSPEIQNDSLNAMRVGSPVLKSATKFTMEDQGYPDADIDALAETLNNVSRAVMLPPQQWIYLRDNMMPYLRGERGFDACYKDLLHVLELYIDE